MVLQQNQGGKSLKCSLTDLALRYLFFADGPHSRLLFHLHNPSYFSPFCAAHSYPKLLPALGNLLYPAAKGLSRVRAELS